MNMRARLVETDFDIPALLAAVADPACGAQALFLGTVRNRNDGREVLAIDYSAYRSMAENVLARIVTDLESGEPGLRMALEHRLGRITVGGASIAIVAASPRRDAALDAVRRALQRVKTEAPIWKHEIYADGSRSWREQEPLVPTAP
ncbi:MAG: molybdenum cofactor biosynthesis protein MoaE [Thermoanaerobaculia bacterium]